MKEITYEKLKDIKYLNQCIDNNLSAKVIEVCEEHQITEINKIYNYIVDAKDKIVLITGPSSSGKTTFAERLSAKFSIKPQILSIDDFFFDRTQLLKNKNKDHFESVSAVNIELFSKTVEGLLSGVEVWLPKFNFVTGESLEKFKRVKLNDGQVIFVEGIHALNPALLFGIADAYKIRIYIHLGSDIELPMDEFIKKEDLRLIRRMVRDYQYRGCSPQRTMVYWEGVRKYEIPNILPYEHEADMVFNSFLPYEPCVLKILATKLVEEIGKGNNETIAKNVAKLLEGYSTIDSSLVPDYSILREFI